MTDTETEDRKRCGRPVVAGKRRYLCNLNINHRGSHLRLANKDPYRGKFQSSCVRCLRELNLIYDGIEEGGVWHVACYLKAR